MITLTGNPLSTQHIYRYACRGNFPAMYMDKKGKDRKEQYQWEAKAQWKGEPLQGEVEIFITLYFGDKRIRDVDNFSKICLDALSGIVYEDDNQIKQMTVRKEYDKERPRIEIKALQTKIDDL